MYLLKVCETCPDKERCYEGGFPMLLEPDCEPDALFIFDIEGEF